MTTTPELDRAINAAALLAERKAREVEVGELKNALKPFVDATIQADLDDMVNNDKLFQVNWQSKRGFNNASIFTTQDVKRARQALKGPTP